MISNIAEAQQPRFSSSSIPIQKGVIPLFHFMKQGPQFYRQVATLTIPIVLQNVITSTLTMADAFMVGLLGEEQMAALTLANIPVFVLQLFLFGVQSGGTILMSQYWGKQDLDAIQRVMGLSMILCFLATGSFAFVMFQFPLEFLSLFGNDPEVIALAASYGKLIGFAFVFNGFSLMYVAAYRSMGQTKLGMYLLGVSMILNLFLNWVFIFGKLGAPTLGVQGAAVATFMARTVEFTLMILHAFTSKTMKCQLKILLSPGKEIIGKFKKHGSMVIFNETAWGLGTSVYPSVMGHMEGSTEILAAMSIATNMERILMVAGFGMAASTSILIGNAIGAGTPREKVFDMANCLATVGTIIGTISGIILLIVAYTLLPYVLAPIFLLSPEATEIAQLMLAMLALFMGLRTFNNICVVGIFRGGGDTKKSMIVDLSSLWLFAIPLSILVGLVWKLSIFWVTFAMAMETALKFLVGLYFLKKRDWIRNVTESEPIV